MIKNYIICVGDSGDTYIPVQDNERVAREMLEMKMNSLPYYYKPLSGGYNVQQTSTGADGYVGSYIHWRCTQVMVRDMYSAAFE